MAKNFLVIIILCSSSFFLSLSVNGDQINHEKINKTSATSKKTKRAIEVDHNNLSSQNDLIPQSPTDSSASNEIPSNGDILGPLQPLSFAKRAPSGFTGMRGKKQQEYTDISPNDLDWSFDDDYGYNDFRYKKAPSGFNGVRGKKMDHHEYETSLLDQLLHRLYQENTDQQDTYKSSVPLYALGYSMGGDWENSIQKRAPVGFTGMRGKRPLDLPFDGGKRNPNAFFGVRGKRDFKRSTIQQFNSGYFGMRGKKQPGFLGFRNKFVGVRGKKDVTGAALHQLDSQQLLEIPVSYYRSSPRFLIDSPEFLALKRTPNGFLGMRGKRQVNTGALDNDL